MDGSRALDLFDPCRGGIDVNTALEGGVKAFAEPWHAQAFATAIALSRAGLFSWAAWVETFSTEIRENPRRSDETGEDAYYRQWLKSLETIVVASGRVAPDEIAEAMEHWRRSFVSTPHGKPIEFRRDLPDAPDMEVDRDHDHHDHEGDIGSIARPVSVSPAAGS